MQLYPLFYILSYNLKNHIMRKLISTALLLIFLFCFGFSQKSTIIKLNSEKNEFKVTALKSTSFNIQSSLAELNLIPISGKDGNFMNLEASGLLKIYKEGAPNIPVISRLIEIPQGAEFAYRIVSFDEEIIKLSDYGITDKIHPALASQSKSEDDVPFVFDHKIYQTDDYTNNEIVYFEESGQLRSVRLGRLEVRPVQYNPVQNTLRILNNLVIEISFKNADLSATENLKRKYSSPYFNNMVSNLVINPSNTKELITQAPTHMVIVSDRMFESQLQPFIAWKIKKGFEITIGYTDEIGSDNASIKTWLQNIYEGDNPMSFVLFVGDIQQIPEWNTNEHTDLRYCEYTGDNLPEVYYGRFSAQNTDQLQPQIDKTLMYEQYTMSDPSYLEHVFLVAGDDSGHEMTWGNGQIWYGDNYYFNESNNVFSHTFLQPLNNSAISDSIIDNMNRGLSFANYTAHCSPSGWATPSFSTSDVYNLTNSEKYGLWIGNCCSSVEFHQDECFGEAALRKEDGGAIGDIGGSNSTYWDEDYWWGVGLTSSIVAEPSYEESGRGAYDGIWHTLDNESGDISTWYPAQGQINMVGNLAVEASTSSRKQYYWEIYHLMGDPSVTNYIGMPEVMTVTPSPSTLMLGMTSLDISSAPYAYVALSQDGELIAAAMSDDSGNATLNFASDAIMVGDADLVVTCQNKVPYIGTIGVSPADEPYVVLNSYTTDIDPDFGSTVSLNVTLENVAELGSGYNAGNVTAQLSITDDYVSVIDGSETFGTINAGETSEINAAFQISIADDVPDQYAFSFDLEITGDDAKYDWPATLNMTANAPELSVGNMSITNDDDENGVLDPGESAVLTITANNNGHADATNVLSTLYGNSPYFTVMDNYQTVSVSAEGTTDIHFNVSASDNAPEGTTVNMTCELVQGVYQADNEDVLVIGQPTEVIVDNGTQSSNYYPFYSYYENNRSQILYLGSELGAGELNIQEIAFDFTNTDSEITSLTDLQINVLETSLTSLGSSYVDMSSAVNILTEASYSMPQTNGWYSFDVTDFTFDASQNLIIEIIWGDNGNYGANNDYYTLNSSSTSFTSVVYGYHDTETPPNYDGNTDVRPNITFFVEGEEPGESFNIMFTVVDENSTPMTDASVMVGTYNQEVDENGQAMFELLADDYYYSVNASNFAAHENILFTVSEDDEITVMMYPLSVDQISENIKIYPNPNTGNFFVNLSNLNEDANLFVYDIRGHAVYEQSLVNEINEIKLSNLSGGIYFLIVKTKDSHYSSKLIIK